MKSIDLHVLLLSLTLFFVHLEASKILQFDFGEKNDFPHLPPLSQEEPEPKPASFDHNSRGFPDFQPPPSFPSPSFPAEEFRPSVCPSGVCPSYRPSYPTFSSFPCYPCGRSGHCPSGRSFPNHFPRIPPSADQHPFPRPEEFPSEYCPPNSPNCQPQFPSIAPLPYEKPEGCPAGCCPGFCGRNRKPFPQPCQPASFGKSEQCPTGCCPCSCSQNDHRWGPSQPPFEIPSQPLPSFDPSDGCSTGWRLPFYPYCHHGELWWSASGKSAAEDAFQPQQQPNWVQTSARKMKK